MLFALSAWKRDFENPDRNFILIIKPEQGKITYAASMERDKEILFKMLHLISYHIQYKRGRA